MESSERPSDRAQSTDSAQSAESAESGTRGSGIAAETETSAETRGARFARKAHRTRLYLYAGAAVALIIFLIALVLANTERVEVSWVFGDASCLACLAGARRRRPRDASGNDPRRVVSPTHANAAQLSERERSAGFGWAGKPAPEDRTPISVSLFARRRLRQHLNICLRRCRPPRYEIPDTSNALHGKL